MRESEQERQTEMDRQRAGQGQTGREGQRWTRGGERQVGSWTDGNRQTLMETDREMDIGRWRGTGRDKRTDGYGRRRTRGGTRGERNRRGRDRRGRERERDGAERERWRQTEKEMETERLMRKCSYVVLWL